jgi:hypothetical protein
MPGYVHLIKIPFPILTLIHNIIWSIVVENNQFIFLFFIQLMITIKTEFYKLMLCIFVIQI